MANFSIEAVETLDYDFTGFPSTRASGNCTGKGVIPEPTHDRLRAYGEGLEELYGVKKDDVKGAMEDDQKAEKPMGAEDRQARLLELTAELCQNTPSAENLKELPPRICNAFMKWVYKELADPEVSGAATRR